MSQMSQLSQFNESMILSYIARAIKKFWYFFLDFDWNAVWWAQKKDENVKFKALSEIAYAHKPINPKQFGKS